MKAKQFLARTAFEYCHGFAVEDDDIPKRFRLKLAIQIGGIIYEEDNNGENHMDILKRVLSSQMTVVMGATFVPQKNYSITESLGVVCNDDMLILDV